MRALPAIPIRAASGGGAEITLVNYDRCGLDAIDHGAPVMLYWLRHVANELDGDLRYDRPAIDQRVTAVFERLLDRYRTAAAV